MPVEAAPAQPRRRIPRPWQDRGGRFSPLRAAVLALAILPGALLLLDLAAGALGAEPWKAATRQAGALALQALLASLAVTPLRFVADWPKAATLRRMLGLVALGYAVLHLLLYAGHQGWSLGAVATEIALRAYLTLGFAVVLGLSVLGWTSTDDWQARLGRRWKRLHRAVYVLAAGGVLHAFLQSKARADGAALLAGLFLWLMLWRALPGRWRAHPPALAGLALAAAASTALVEAAWYAVATNLPAARILAANLDLAAGMRPAHWVALAGLCVAPLPWLRRAWRPPGRVERGPPLGHGARRS
ncbi:sulfite oxidase heme-binding subunit YedZ [Falsiroseomonas sp. CW058]|uniref:sulfite oxidase heme-binding subunit YedZ n=1 Tax=Falsiroseomonas sp. CW058 TaxID=3388664 RepID=UPI003D318E1F